MIKKNSTNHALYISNNIFAFKKLRVLHKDNLTNNNKNSGIKLLINIELICQILPAFFDIKNGVSDVSFEFYRPIYANFR